MSARAALELVVEVEDHFGKGQFKCHIDTIECREVALTKHRTAYVECELHDGADIFIRSDDLRTDERLHDVIDQRRFGSCDGLSDPQFHSFFVR